MLTVFLKLFVVQVYAEPASPTITVLDTTSKLSISAKINSTVGSRTAGGYMFTMNLDVNQQNMHWKAFVGNVSGTLKLDDNVDNSLYEWSYIALEGEVYATRASGNINWSGINCTWVADGKNNALEGFYYSNRSPEHNENEFLSHTGKDDNITSTFVNTNHTSITIGPIVLGKNECFTLQTWQRDHQQVFSDSDYANFTQIILYDGAYNKLDGNVVYAAVMRNGIAGYNNYDIYNFQMLVPENAGTGFSSSTAYYFYAELS